VSDDPGRKIKAHFQREKAFLSQSLVRSEKQQRRFSRNFESTIETTAELNRNETYLPWRRNGIAQAVIRAHGAQWLAAASVAQSGCAGRCGRWWISRSLQRRTVHLVHSCWQREREREIWTRVKSSVSRDIGENTSPCKIHPSNVPCPVDESPLGDLLWCWLFSVFNVCGRVCKVWPAKIGSLVVRLCVDVANVADVGSVP